MLRTSSRDRSRASVALILVGVLAGCAAPAPVDEEARLAAWETRLEWLRGVSAWRASGRVAVASGDESWSANVRWRQSAADYRIDLSGPFGQGAVRVDGAADAVVLTTADGRVVRAHTPEALIAAELGVQVPVSVLRYWLVGRPAPDSAPRAMELDAAGRLERLAQAGWQVRYEQYVDSGSGVLPARLELRRGAVRARFLISRWQVGT